MDTAKLRPFGIFFLAFGLSLTVGVALITLLAGIGAVLWELLGT